MNTLINALIFVSLIAVDLFCFYVAWRVGYDKGYQRGQHDKLEEIREFQDDSNR